MTHSDLKGEKIVIHWNIKDEESIKLIRARFNIPKYTTLNGFTPAILPVHDLAMFLRKPPGADTSITDGWNGISTAPPTHGKNGVKMVAILFAKSVHGD